MRSQGLDWVAPAQLPPRCARTHLFFRAIGYMFGLVGGPRYRCRGCSDNRYHTYMPLLNRQHTNDLFRAIESSCGTTIGFTYHQDAINDPSVTVSNKQALTAHLIPSSANEFKTVIAIAYHPVRNKPDAYFFVCSSNLSQNYLYCKAAQGNAFAQWSRAPHVGTFKTPEHARIAQDIYDSAHNNLISRRLPKRPFLLETSKSADHWSEIVEAVASWAAEVNPYTPDLWKDRDQQYQLVTNQERINEAGNAPFDASEQAQIADQIRAIKSDLNQQGALTQQVIAKLDEAEEASHRLGRKDWLNLFMGILLTLIITGLVTPEMVQHVLAMTLQCIGHLFGLGDGPPKPLP